MLKAHQYTAQTILALFQSLLVVSGSLATAFVLKTRGYPDVPLSWHPFPVLVRSWGFSLLLIPWLWAVATVWMEAHPAGNFSRRWTMSSGVLVLVGLLFLFFVSLVLASGAGTLIQTIK